jgi:spermidine/putrescine transport system ATP-binding protein
MRRYRGRWWCRVCTYDAVRVLHRSAAEPITDPVAQQVGALSVT